MLKCLEVLKNASTRITCMSNRRDVMNIDDDLLLYSAIVM